MKFYQQTQMHDPDNDVIGNCLRACIATVLQVDINEFPAFEQQPRYMSEDWREVVDEYLALYGKRMKFLPPTSLPSGYSIISGRTNRFGGEVLHSCVAFNGVMVFDPHPTHAGLKDVRDYIVLEEMCQGGAS